MRQDLASRQVAWTQAQERHEALVLGLRADKERLGDELSKEAERAEVLERDLRELRPAPMRPAMPLNVAQGTDSVTLTMPDPLSATPSKHKPTKPSSAGAGERRADAWSGVLSLTRVPAVPARC